MWAFTYIQQSVTYTLVHYELQVVFKKEKYDLVVNPLQKLQLPRFYQILKYDIRINSEISSSCFPNIDYD